MSAQAMASWRAIPKNRERELQRRRANYDPTIAKQSRDRYTQTHREELLDSKRERYHAGRARAYHLKSKYNISVVAWLVLFRDQGYRCACCGRADPSSAYGWHTDHDHTVSPTKVRGILCHHCNIIVGHAKDDTYILMRAIGYLEST